MSVISDPTSIIKIYVANLTPSLMVLGGGGSCEVIRSREGVLMGMSDPRETPESSLALSTMRACNEKMAICEPGGSSSLDQNRWHLACGLPRPRTVRNKCLSTAIRPWNAWISSDLEATQGWGLASTLMTEINVCDLSHPIYGIFNSSLNRLRQ